MPLAVGFFGFFLRNLSIRRLAFSILAISNDMVATSSCEIVLTLLYTRSCPECRRGRKARACTSFFGGNLQLFQFGDDGFARGCGVHHFIDGEDLSIRTYIEGPAVRQFAEVSA